MPSPQRARLRGERARARLPVPHDVRDDELLAGFGASNADAAAEFVRRFQRRVYGLAYTILRDPRAAEDVAQEALTRAWRNAAVYDARRGSVVSWVSTIARNLAIDVSRARRADPVDPEVLQRLSFTATGGDPATAALVHDDVDRLRVALGTLPEEQRRAVVLSGIWGLTAR